MSRLPFLALFLLCFILFNELASADPNSLMYRVCSEARYTTGTPYDLNVNSLFLSLTNAAAISNYNSFNENNLVYGLFQCEGDLSSSLCKDCVATALSQLKTICSEATSGVIQLEECFVKYGSASFIGVLDKTEVWKNCGPSIGYDSDTLKRLDAGLANLSATNEEYFRSGGSGSVQGVAQCVQDISFTDCRDCLTEASGRLRLECETSTWGDMFLGKCYIRYGDREHHSNKDDEDVDKKTLVVTFGVVAGLLFLILCLAWIVRYNNNRGGDS